MAFRGVYKQDGDGSLANEDRTMRSQELVLQQYNTDKVGNKFLDLYDARFQHLVDRPVKILEIGIHNGGSLLLWRDYFPKGTIVGVDLKIPEGWVDQDRIRVFQGSQDDTTFLGDVARRTAPEGFDLIIDDASHIGSLTKAGFYHLFDNHLKPSGLYVIEDWITGYWDEWPDGMCYRTPEPPKPGKVKTVLRKAFHGLPRSMRERIKKMKTLSPVRRQLQPPPPINKTPFHNHSYGLVGFIKELVDEQGASALTQGGLSGPAPRPSRFEKMEITPQIVFITKRNSGAQSAAA
jgi:hypothetical protein